MVIAGDALRPPLFSVPGCRVIYERAIGSTNAAAAELARAGAEHRTIVVAEEQTAGRGRRGRGWSSGLGGAMFSTILRPRFSPEAAQRIPLVASVAVAEACAGVCGISPGVKWPNDIMINGKKVCGILAESSAEDGRILYIVLGVGMNVCQSAEDFPPELRETATSLAMETGAAVMRSDFIRSFIERFFIWYNKMESMPAEFFWDQFEPAYRARSVTLGERVTVILSGESFEAKAERLGESGELWVSTDGGYRRAVWAADVSVRSVVRN